MRLHFAFILSFGLTLSSLAAPDSGLRLKEEGTFLEEASFRFDWPLSYHDGKVSFHSFQSH